MPIISFYRGSRHYTIRLCIDGDKIQYGAAIYRNDSGEAANISEEERIKHVKTATERLNRFPVTVSWKGYPEETRTRGQKLTYLNSNKFKREMVTILCNNGVRYRPSGSPPETCSIREQQFIQQMNKTTKDHNRVMDKYEKNKIVDEDQVSHDVRARILAMDAERLDENMPFFECVFDDRHSDRIFHIIYRRTEDGQMEYGACVFNPKTEEDWNNYDEERHFDTAWERFERFPVKGINLNFETHGYRTRQATSGEVSIYNDEAMLGLRKCIAKYGVRSRKGTMFLKSAEKWTKCMSETKNFRREYQKVDEEYHSWRERTTHGQTVTV